MKGPYIYVCSSQLFLFVSLPFNYFFHKSFQQSNFLLYSLNWRIRIILSLRGNNLQSSMVSTLRTILSSSYFNFHASELISNLVELVKDDQISSLHAPSICFSQSYCFYIIPVVNSSPQTSNHRDNKRETKFNNALKHSHAWWYPLHIIIHSFQP